MIPTVLIVDDDADDADLLLLAFRRHGAAVNLVVVRDAAEALEYLEVRAPVAGRPARRPAVVLLDLKLRRTSGLPLLRRLRESTATAALPVIMMTSSAERTDIHDAYASGANAYVRKPDTFEALVELAGVILAFWVSFNEVPDHGMDGAR